jgi:hypothetical protein
MTTDEIETAVRPTCPRCGCREVNELFASQIAYPVSDIHDGGCATGEGVAASEGRFDGFQCRDCFFESDEIADFVAPDPDFEPSYSPWRHDGWYVHGVTHKNGGIGCVSRNYPDRMWRIVCDSRGIGHTYKSRDEAARAEYALTLAGVIE